MFQALKPEPQIMRYELSDYEWTAIKPMLPNKPRGVRRVNDRCVLNGVPRSRVAPRSLKKTRPPIEVAFAAPNTHFLRGSSAGLM
jgi:hypothetical protein